MDPAALLMNDPGLTGVPTPDPGVPGRVPTGPLNPSAGYLDPPAIDTIESAEIEYVEALFCASPNVCPPRGPTPNPLCDIPLAVPTEGCDSPGGGTSIPSSVPERRYKIIDPRVEKLLGGISGTGEVRSVEIDVEGGIEFEELALRPSLLDMWREKDADPVTGA